MKKVTGALMSVLVLAGCASYTAADFALPDLPPGEFMQTVTTAASARPVAAEELSRIRGISEKLTPPQQQKAATLFGNGFQLWQSGDFPAAMIAFRDGLAIDPANPPANFYYGDLLARSKRRTEAATHFSIAVQLGEGTVEGLKAQAALEALRTPTLLFSEMSEDEKASALLGVWVQDMTDRTAELRPRFRISRVSGDTAVAQGRFWNRLISSAHFENDELVVVYSWSMSLLLSYGKATMTDHLKLDAPGHLKGRRHTVIETSSSAPTVEDSQVEYLRQP